MSLLQSFAQQALSFAKSQVERIAGAPEAGAAVQSLRTFLGTVRDFADPPTQAEIDDLEARVFAGLDATIDKLGDG